MNLANSSIVIDQGGPFGSLREALIDAWQLVACVETDVETGEIFLPMGPYPAGFILSTPDGYMSAQLSSLDRADFSDNGRSAVKGTTTLDSVIAELVEASRAKAAA
jgi:Lipocalin-like domain